MISWDQYFLAIAKTASIKSKDPKTKVGAVIVDEDNRIVSTGFNGYPPGYDDSSVDWSNRDQIRSTISHAEENAILFSRISLKKCKLYTTLAPCTNCLKMAATAGIKEIYYLNDYSKNSIPQEYIDLLGLKITKISE